MNTEDIIRRPLYLDHILSVINRGMMLMLVGQRRVGKSFVLLDLKRWLEENEPNANVLYIDREQRIGEALISADELYQTVIETLPENGRNYLLIDELQNIENYDVALRNLYSENRCQIVATGSNAKIFSTELGTRLGARYIEIPIYSLTYTEFLIFHNLPDEENSLMLYLKVGGLPGLRHFNLNDIRQVRDYIQGVYTTIMMRDIVEREKIRNLPFMTQLAKFLADTSGKLVSPNSIAGTMISQGEKVSGPMTNSYITHLCNALVVRPVWRYDIHGKKIFEQNFKYYFSDLGIRNYLCGMQVRRDIERLMETAVWHHLLTQGFEITVGVLRKGEIDFVATRVEKVIYFQVAYILPSQETIDREFGNLQSIKDSYPKYVISMDPISGEVEGYPGIHLMNLREFLKTEF